MRFLTRQQLVNAVVTEIGLVSGTNVQLFTEPQIESKIILAFDTLAEKRFWPHLMKNTIHELDGSIGVITDSGGMSLVSSIEDIQWIREYPYENRDKLFFLNGETYEASYSRPAYDTLSWDHEQYQTKLFQVYPLDSTFKIMVRARRTPEGFPLDSSIIPFDGVAMTHYLSWLLLSSEGMNPASQDVQYALFEQRYEDLTHNETAAVSVYKKTGPSRLTVADES